PPLRYGRARECCLRLHPGRRPTGRNEGTFPASTNGSAEPLFLPGHSENSSLRWARSDADEAPMNPRRILIALTLLPLAALAQPPAFGSAIIGRNVRGATLSIDHQGHAHVSYRTGGRSTSLVAPGPINARGPSRSVPQVKFRIRYGAGGRGACLPYDG